jgi:hypothetical protein
MALPEETPRLDEDRFRVIVIDALPSEVFDAQYGFSKLSQALNEEAKTGWVPRQVSTSWAQSYMVFTVVLEKEQHTSDLRSPRSQVHRLADILDDGKIPFDDPYPRVLGSFALALLLLAGGIVGGLALLFFGLVRALAVSNAVILGGTIFGGFVLPAVLVVAGLWLIVFCSYEVGTMYRSPSNHF